MTLLAPGTVADILGVSVSRVIQLDREGQLLALRDSARRRLYRPADVEAFRLAREAKRGPPTVPRAEERWPGRRHPADAHPAAYPVPGRHGLRPLGRVAVVEP